RSSTSYSYGVFVGVTVEILSFGLLGDVCPGTLCDSLYSGHHRCPCVTTGMIPGWVVKLVIEAEIQRKWLEDEFTITTGNGNLPAQLSVASSFDLLRIITLESAFIKPSSVSGIVNSTVNDVSQHGGCDLVIWNKASQGQGENDTGIKPPKNHLVRLSPSKLPDDVQRRARAAACCQQANNRNGQQGNNRNGQQGNNRNDQQGDNNNGQQGNNQDWAWRFGSTPEFSHSMTGRVDGVANFDVRGFMGGGTATEGHHWGSL
ncbi:hypothetical protein FOZ63_023317, partial [Perkinsus olseni]